jgi:hypothetical protein
MKMVINCRPEYKHNIVFPCVFRTTSVFFFGFQRERHTVNIYCAAQCSSTCGIKKHYYSQMFVGGKFDDVSYARVTNEHNQLHFLYFYIRMLLREYGNLSLCIISCVLFQCVSNPLNLLTYLLHGAESFLRS